MSYKNKCCTYIILFFSPTQLASASGQKAHKRQDQDPVKAGGKEDELETETHLPSSPFESSRSFLSKMYASHLLRPYITEIFIYAASLPIFLPSRTQMSVKDVFPTKIGHNSGEESTALCNRLLLLPKPNIYLPFSKHFYHDVIYVFLPCLLSSSHYPIGFRNGGASASD